jgi:hypothetical protein
MGEVTNAWVTVQNGGQVDFKNLTITLVANDEEKQHPDKSTLVQSLPPAGHLTYKLTVDTKSGVDTSIKVLAKAQDGAAAESTKANCQELTSEESTAILDAGELAPIVRVAQPDSSESSSPQTSATQEVTTQYVEPIGRIWAGVKVYYGRGAQKTYGFVILGGSDECKSMPSGRGIKVRYPDSTEEWKDRMAILESGIFFVLADDPAAKAHDWYVFNDCP